MARVKGGKTTRRRHKRVLKRAKGFKWGHGKKYRIAKETLLKAGAHAYRDRRLKKRDARALWQIRINAAARANEISYSKLISRLKSKGVALDRKVLSEIASKHPGAFKDIAAIAKDA